MSAPRSGDDPRAASDEGGRRPRRVGTGVVLTLFFLTLLAVNAAFFVIALSNPPEEIPPAGAAPSPAAAPRDAGPSAGDG